MGNRSTRGYTSYSCHRGVGTVLRLTVTGALKAGLTISVIALSAGSKSENNADQRTGRETRTAVVSPGGLDFSSLREVHNFADFPEGVRSLANDNFMRQMSDNQFPRFLVGGVSESRAIIAFEEFGYVPVFKAVAYEHKPTGWTYVRRWDSIGPVNDLQKLLHVLSVTP